MIAPPSADEFLAAIFAGVEGAVVLARPTKGRGYFQRPWQQGAAAELVPGAWYWCMSTSSVDSKVDRNDVATITRRKQDLARTCALVLDDIGTKVSTVRVDQLLPPPSAIVETSPANFQWVYILDGGTDPQQAATALERLAAAEITDPGAKDASHIFRLPGSINDKVAVLQRNGGQPWSARVTLWEPDRRYTVEEIVERVPVIEPKAKRKAKVSGHAPHHPATQRGDYPARDKHDIALKCLAHIPNDGSFVARDAWLEIGMALHDATDGAVAGQLAWASWTAQQHANAQDACADAWKSFKAGGGRTLGTLVEHARRCGFDPYSQGDPPRMERRSQGQGTTANGHGAAEPPPPEQGDPGREGDGESDGGGETNDKDQGSLADCLYENIMDEAADQPEPLVVEIVPAEVVGVISGSGGAGKGILLQTLCTCVASTNPVPFLGYAVKTHGLAIFWTAEDRLSQLLYRQRQINKTLGIDRENLRGRLVLKSHREPDCILWLNGRPTKLLLNVLADAEQLEGRLLTLDSASICYGDDEIKRRDVASFLRYLDLWAERMRCTIIVVLHTSRTSDGSVERLSSGTTAWTFQARFALLLQKDGDRSALTVAKINYGKPGLKVDLNWTNDGVLVAEEKATGMVANLQDNKDDALVLSEIAARWDDPAAEPLTKAANTKDRYLPAFMNRKHGWKTRRGQDALTRLADAIKITTGETRKGGREMSGLKPISAEIT